MSEIPNDRFYHPSKALRWFAIASFAMMIATLWMVFDDYVRTWKGYQREFFQLQTKKFEEQIESAEEDLDSDELEEITEAVKEAEKNVASRSGEIEALDTELVDLKTKESISKEAFQAAKAAWDVQKYHYEAKYGHYIAEQKEFSEENQKESLSALNEEFARVSELENVYNSDSQAVLDNKNKRNAVSDGLVKAKKALGEVRKELDRLLASKEETKLVPHKVALQNIPLLDWMDPTFKIRKVVPPGIRYDYEFAKVGTIDACMTCHMSIDRKGYEDQPNPFKTHPRLDLMVGSTSVHSIAKVGCTSCHAMRGPAVDFVRAAHVPQNEEQAAEWAKKYGWSEHALHYIPERGIPLQYTEGKCRTCHRETEFVPQAEKLNKAVNVVKSAQCYGCHKITGFEHLRKAAPSLKKIKGKVTKDWFVKWVRNPESFNKNARMPRFFHLENVQSAEFKQFQEAEIFALADYIYELSEDYSPNVRMALGNVERGKQLFGEQGCLGCHNIDDFVPEDFPQYRFGRAPDLSTVGSKVSKDWLMSWLKNPQHYWAGSVMPSLRLTNSQIRDITAYLLTKKNPEFEALPVGSPDLEIQKKLLRVYLQKDTSLAPVTDKKKDAVMAGLNDAGVVRKLGEKAVRRYGCYGCHEVKGFENEGGIGAELSEHGSKLVKRLDFGLLHIDHTRQAWFKQKLENTRIFDRGKAVAYLDTLRMPQFSFNEEERDLIVMFLLGMTSDKFRAPANHVLTASEKKFEDGMRVIHKYNCQGCHIVENIYQPLPEDHPNFDDHELNQYQVEGSILAHYQEDVTLGPPSIWGEGKKVRTSWVNNFLKAPFPLRARLKVKMPTFPFTEDERNKILAMWGNESGEGFPYEKVERVSLSPSQLATAKQLFKGLACLNCHTAGEKLSAADLEGSRGLAPDFLLTHERLRKKWVMDWLANPSDLMPGTRMPAFWPDGTTPFPEILGGDAQAQMQLITDYLIYLGQSRSGGTTAE